MRLAVALLMGVVAGLMAPSVFADMYKCVDDAGHVTYANLGGKGCKRLLSDPAGAAPGSKAAARQPSPADFPKVGGSTQKARDDDRRRILETELKTEQEGLEAARRKLAEQEATRQGDEKNYQRVLDRLQPFKDAVALHERNLEALKKEMGNLK